MHLGQKYIFLGHLDDGEKLFEVFHRHSIEIWKRSIAWVLLGIVFPLWVIFYAHDLGYSWTYDWWIIGIWIALSFSWIAYHFIDWYFDVLLITNYSMLHVQWHGLFDREASRIEYEDIKEINISSDGALQAIFNYGKIQILSISGGKTILKNMKDPQNMEQVIRKYKTNYQKFQRFTDGEGLEKILTEMVGKHVWQYGSEHGFLPRR